MPIPGLHAIRLTCALSQTGVFTSCAEGTFGEVSHRNLVSYQVLDMFRRAAEGMHAHLVCTEQEVTLYREEACFTCLPLNAMFELTFE